MLIELTKSHSADSEEVAMIMTIREAARHYGVDTKTIRRRMEDGRIKKAPACVVVPVSRKLNFDAINALLRAALEEAAGYARVSTGLIRKWLTERTLRAVKTGDCGGGRSIIDRQDLDALLESRKQ